MSSPPTRIAAPRLTARVIASCCPKAMSMRPTTPTPTPVLIAMTGLHVYSGLAGEVPLPRSRAWPGLDRCPREETGHDDAGLVQEIEGHEDDHHVKVIGRRGDHRGEDQQD